MAKYKGGIKGKIAGKEFGLKFKGGRNPTPLEISASVAKNKQRHKTARHRATTRAEALKTGSRAGAAGSVGNTTVNSAYDLLKGGVNEDESNGDQQNQGDQGNGRRGDSDYGGRV